MAEWADSGKLFQRNGAQEWKALVPVLVLTLGTDRLIPWFDLSTGWGWINKHGVKINRLFFALDILSQQIDLEKYLKPYWQPMKGMKQWNTAGKWRWLCHNVSQSILNALKFGEVNVGDTIIIIPYKGELQ